MVLVCSKKMAHTCRPLAYLFIRSMLVISLSVVCVRSQEEPTRPNNNNNDDVESRSAIDRPPSPVQSASYVSLDGLTLVINFDRPVNLSASIESVEQRRASASAASNAGYEPTQPDQSQPRASKLKKSRPDLHQAQSALSPNRFPPSSQQLVASTGGQCNANNQDPEDHTNQTPHLVEGVQICGQLLSKKTLKLLRKFKLFNCVWASRVQFLIQLGRPATTTSNQQQTGGLIRVSFQRGTISEFGALGSNANEREVSVELNKLPLEGLGVPLTPKLALTGPNQVPPCGQFWLSAHLSSPFGTQLNESVHLQWSVDRVGLLTTTTTTTNNGSSPAAAEDNNKLIELRWQTLRQVVASQRTNNLLLDAQLLQFMPQLYEFKLQVTFVTSLTSVTLNATHQVGRLDFEAPIGTIYGSHMLAQDAQLNTQQDLLLMADIQVPECAQNVKQVGLYWQVSDPRVRFEQNYAPFYLAKSNSLPEQALIEFRLNLFYGIRVKKFASAGTVISTGDSTLDAQISDGLLMASVGNSPGDQSSAGDKNSQLELYATSRHLSEQDNNKYAYQWSCFDGKTAQPCYKSLKVQASSNGTRYDIGGPSGAASVGQNPLSGGHNNNQASSASSSGLLLVDKPRQRQPILRLPLSWLDADSQLWFGLQRFDRHQPSQHSKTEYALVSVHGQPYEGSLTSIGPVLLGRARQRAHLRNPLTGAMILIANAPAVIVGRLGPVERVGSFRWRLPNYVHPLHWTSRNETNPLTKQDELVTELHLNPRLLVAHAHHQVQLVSCSKRTGLASVASLSLDIVQPISQCRVEVAGAQDQQAVGPQTSGGQPLVVSVNYCNIPLGLSPVTYQLYMIDTSASDGFIESNRPAGQTAPRPDDDYINEADEMFLESQAQPMSAPQLSPVFSLTSGTLDLSSLVSSINQQGAQANQQQTHLRFAARACDRLQSCKMFYSNSINLQQLAALLSQPQATSGNLQANSSNQSVALRQIAPPTGGGFDQSDNGEQLKQFKNKSQAVQGLKNMIDSAKRANLAGNSIAAISILDVVVALGQRMLSTGRQLGATDEPLQDDQLDEQLRQLIQVAMRDILNYVSVSIRRQFHYTESGQTNLVVHAMANILAAKTNLFASNAVEYKFRTMRLLVQLLQKTTQEELNSNRKLNCLPDLKSIRYAFESLMGTFNQHSIEQSASSHSGHKRRQHNKPSKQTNSTVTFADNNNNLFASPTSPASSSLSLIGGSSNKSNKKKREEAVLAYLSLVRQAHRALVQVAAMQLPLGSIEQLEYSTDGNGNRERPSEIVTSMTHQTELQSDPIEVDLHQFGGIIIKFELPDQSERRNLIQQVTRDQPRCRQDASNGTSSSFDEAHCSGFVLAVTSFAQKAPFRSLDAPGRLPTVPIVQVDWLSALDGSSLVAHQSGDQKRKFPFKASVTFIVQTTGLSDQNNSTSYKCYKFDEQANEWSLLEQQEQPGDQTNLVSTTEEDEQQNIRRIRCTFGGSGVVAAFQGRPPEPETSIEFTIALGVLVVMTIVAILSLLGCLASSSRSRRGSSSQVTSSGYTDDGTTSSDTNSANLHPEMSGARIDYNYPLKR